MSLLDDLFNEARAEGFAEGWAEGRAKGEAKASRDLAARLIKYGKYSLEEIADICELPLSDVQELAQNLPK